MGCVHRHWPRQMMLCGAPVSRHCAGHGAGAVSISACFSVCCIPLSRRFHADPQLTKRPRVLSILQLFCLWSVSVHHEFICLNLLYTALTSVCPASLVWTACCVCQVDLFSLSIFFCQQKIWQRENLFNNQPLLRWPILKCLNWKWFYQMDL